MKKFFILFVAMTLQQTGHAQNGWRVVNQRTDSGLILDSIVYYRADGNGMFVIKSREDRQVQIISERGSFLGILNKSWPTTYCGAYVEFQLYDSLMVFKKDFTMWFDRDSTLAVLKTREKREGVKTYKQGTRIKKLLDWIDGNGYVRVVANRPETGTFSLLIPGRNRK